MFHPFITRLHPATRVECCRIHSGLNLQYNMSRYKSRADETESHSLTFRKHDICSRCQPPLARVLMVILRDAWDHSTGRGKCKTEVLPGARGRECAALSFFFFVLHQAARCLAGAPPCRLERITVCQSDFQYDI